MGVIRNLLQRVGLVQSVRSVDQEPEPDTYTPEEWGALKAEWAADYAAREAREQERAEDAWEMREEEGIAREEAKLLTQEAVAELTAALETPYGSIDGVPYDDLDRQGKLQLLEMSVDWNGYVERGMDPDTPALLMMNAVDGKPPELERWLEQTPEEAASRQAELDGYAQQFEQAAERISANIREREAKEAPLPRTGWEEIRACVEDMKQEVYLEEVSPDGTTKRIPYADMSPQERITAIDQAFDYGGFEDNYGMRSNDIFWEIKASVEREEKEAKSPMQEIREQAAAMAKAQERERERERGKEIDIGD